MPSITSRWKKFVCIGCNHGSYVDPDAVAAVLKFCRSFKPDTRVHLGDILDFAAFRMGAPGTKDESASLTDDLSAGLQLLEQFEPTITLIGNHDDRVFDRANHHNEIIARAAQSCRDEFLDCCKRLKTKLIDVWDINYEHYPKLGDATIIHGFGLGGENAIRDMAAHFGKSICAHFHRAECQTAARSDHPVCYCVGTLSRVRAMVYAKSRRATARWSNGFVWGYYNDTQCIPYISSCVQGQAKNWRLPL